jgi:hypothetical protein
MTVAPNIQCLCSAALCLVVFAAAPAARAADPTMSDCLAANENAGKLQTDKKLRQAREQAAICAAETCPTELHTACRQHVADLNHAIPTIVLQARDASGAYLTEVNVTMDGQPLVTRLEGTAISVDPGQHTFRFETDGHVPLDRTLLLNEGQKDRIESIVFSGGPIPAPKPDDGTLTGGDTRSRGSAWSAQKYIALAAAGVGVIGVALGTAFGFLSLSKKSDAQNACPDATCPTQDGSSKWGDAGSTGNVSTIAFVLGGVGLAGAAALWFTAPSGRASSTPQVGLGPGGIQVRESW